MGFKGDTFYPLCDWLTISQALSDWLLTSSWNVSIWKPFLMIPKDFTVNTSLMLEEVEIIQRKGKIYVLHLEEISNQYFHPFQNVELLIVLLIRSQMLLIPHRAKY